VTDNAEVQSGTATADKWGLVTLGQVKVTRGRNRVRIVGVRRSTQERQRSAN